MKKKTLLLLTFFGAVATAFPQTRKCACGSYSSGQTIEYTVIDSGRDCCDERAVGVNNAYAFKWEPAGANNFTLVETITYPTSQLAQNDCCDEDAA
ncbi:hypothetical protein FUA48_16155 [Flavobacterium alkalisoli]|uniref:Uncharacterized protein n=1 Tax=Flavobacterium alkalisoli TaxID=2602769 RepID=A0A5B9FUQ3_9FLAO|nr:hypothetical protein [Flavobacterium alkalisoli]QEE51053.1 hypothetical protein FUA48_16155 [Flavobacterium alkalisoli]